MRIRFSLLLAAMFAFTACNGAERDSSATVEVATEPTPGKADTSAVVEDVSPEPVEKEPHVELADSPQIDLVANHRRWHVFDEGLIIPFATEGIHKYSQEYKRPYRDVVEIDGVQGRKLKKRVSVLRVPWQSEGAATARIWVHGAKGQRVELKINGRRAGVHTLVPGWNEAVISIKEGVLRKGENEVQLHARSNPIYHSMELIDGSVEAGGKAPRLHLVEDVKHGTETLRSLTGFKRMRMWLEVPESGWIAMQTGSKSAGQAKVHIIGADGQKTTILEAELKTEGWQKHFMDLKDFGNQLVVLEFEAAPDVAWGAPRLALAPAPVREKPAAFQNSILMVVDALRSDRLSLYGETHVASPRFLKEGEERGVVYQHNQSASPSSPPSHGSIQTGMIARVHGVAGDKGDLKPGVELISTQMEKADIKTAYVGNNPFGMRRLKKAGNFSEYLEPNRMGLGIDCAAVVAETLKFAKARNDAGQRFFVSMLPFDTHTPYRYHEDVTPKYFKGPWPKPVGKHVDGYLLNDIAAGRKVLNKTQWKQLRALYDGEVEHTDQCFGVLIDGLEELGLRDSTAIVLTSDHGEGMFEHKKMGHAYGLYSELTNVPLVVFGKGLNGKGLKRVEVPTQVIDIAPTMLDLMGVEPSKRIQGGSVVQMGLRDGPWVPQVVSSEYGRSFSLRSRDWRLVVRNNGDEELYDLKADPTEQTNVAKKNHHEMRYFHEMTGLFLAYRSDWHASTWGNWANHHEGFGE